MEGEKNQSEGEATTSSEQTEFQKQGREEVAIVLDFLQHGYAFDKRPSHQKTPVVQALGIKRFTLLELVPRKDVFLQPNEEVYIGEGKRERIHHIKGRLPFDKLTATARSELEETLKELVAKDEMKFVDFFNNAQPLTMRMHQIELLPGLGKTHMWQIIETRKEKLFESFADIKKRIRLMPDPKVIIVKRIILELSGREKHRVFVR